MKKILKISALAVVGLILLTVGIAFYTQTAQFKSWLKEQIESQFAGMTNGQIEIENIDGNLVTSFKIKDFAIRLNQDTLASVKRLSFRFRPIALLSKRIALNQIRLEEPRIFLARNSDSRWNFQDLIEVAANDSLTSVKEINDENKWAISAKLEIISGLVQISKYDSTEWRGPWLVRDLNLALDLEKKDEELHLSLKDVNFETHNPDILIQSLQGKVVFATNRLEVIDFELMTESSKLTSRLSFDNLDNSGIDFLLEAQPLNFDEVRIFWPDFPLQGSPNIKVVANGPVDSLAVAADLYFSEGVFSVKGTAGLRGSDIQLDLGGQTSNLNLAALTKNSAYKTDLNSQFSVLGTGHVNNDFDGEVRVKLDTSVAMGREISNANLFLTVKEDSAFFSVQTVVEGATADIRGLVFKGVERPEYKVRAKISNLDIARFSFSDSPTSDLNFKIDLNGSGLTEETLSANAKLTLQTSRFDQLPIDSALVETTFENSTLLIERLAVHSPVGDVTAQGKLSSEVDSDIRIHAHLFGGSYLSDLFYPDALADSGEIKTRIRGMPDSLQIETMLQLSNIVVKSKKIVIRDFNGEGSAIYMSGLHHFAFDGTAQDLILNQKELDEVTFAIDYADSVAKFEIAAAKAEQASFISKGSIRFQPTDYVVDFEDLTLTLLGQEWQKSSEPTTLVISDQRFELSPLRLQNSAQEVFLSGRVDFRHENDLTLSISDLELAEYRSLLPINLQFPGKLNFDFNLTGKPDAPVVNGLVEIDQSIVAGIQIQKLMFAFDYAEGLTTWQGVVLKSEDDRVIEAAGEQPVVFSFSPFKFEPLTEEQAQFSLKTREINLAFLQSLSKNIADVQGILTADIELHNTLEQPRGSGFIRIKGGAVKVSSLGAAYKDIVVNLTVEHGKLKIEELQAKSNPDGKISVEEGEISFLPGSFGEVFARLSIDDFQPINTRKMQGDVDGEIKIAGTLVSPRIAGDITLKKVKVDYSQFESSEEIDITSRPYFVIVKDSVHSDSTNVTLFQDQGSVTDSLSQRPTFFDNLETNLSVHIEEGATIKVPFGDIKLTGDLNVHKKDEAFDLDGSLSVTEGIFDLFGNTFEIEKGEMVFAPGSQIKPEISVEASYQYRDYSNRHSPVRVLKVTALGPIDSPELNFTLDGQLVRQEEIISLLLFGQSYYELSHNQKAGLSEQPGISGRTGEMVTSQLLKTTASRLGKPLKLDIVRVESGKFESARELKLGKYINRDILMTVTQEIGSEGDQVVELEYEIPKRFLFFDLLLRASTARRGDSAMDFIWRVELGDNKGSGQ